MNQRPMNPQNPGVIVWDGFPHPDPLMRHVPVTVQLTSALLRRVLRHLSAQDAAWAAWLGQAAIRSLRAYLEGELAHDAPRPDGDQPLPQNVRDVIGATLCASLCQPQAVWFGAADSKSHGHYRLILTNGAIAVLRPLPADPSRLFLEDLFFSPIQTEDQTDATRRDRAMARMTHLHSIRWIEPQIWPDRPALHHPSQPLTPSEITEAVGFSRLFDSLPARSIQSSISSDVAAQAARELRDQLARWTRIASALATELEGASNAYRDELCLSLLENRMSAWARFLAIDETYAIGMDLGKTNPDFEIEIDPLMAAMEAYDEALQAAEVFWAPVAARTELLKNWQARLAGPHRLSLPWFMNATSSDTPLRTASAYRLG